MSQFITNLPQYAAMILFGIGISNLLLNRNMIKKIIGLNIMDTSMYLFLACKGYITGRVAPIIPIEQIGNVDTSLYINPVPSGLVLTGIVVSVSVTAVLLALTVRLYEVFGTLNIDKIIHELHRADREDS